MEEKSTEGNEEEEGGKGTWDTGARMKTAEDSYMSRPEVGQCVAPRCALITREERNKQ